MLLNNTLTNCRRAFLKLYEWKLWCAIYQVALDCVFAYVFCVVLLAQAVAMMSVV